LNPRPTDYECVRIVPNAISQLRAASSAIHRREHYQHVRLSVDHLSAVLIGLTCWRCVAWFPSWRAKLSRNAWPRANLNNGWLATTMPWFSGSGAVSVVWRARKALQVVISGLMEDPGPLGVLPIPLLTARS